MKKSVLFSANDHKRFFSWQLCALFGMIFFEWTASHASEVKYDARGRRDPFVPLVSANATVSSGELLSVEKIEDLRVEGVVFDSKKGSVVILNGQMMKEGQEIGNVKVIKIKPAGVEVSIAGQEGFKPIYDENTTGKGN